jgi:hypothetical protein
MTVAVAVAVTAPATAEQHRSECLLWGVFIASSAAAAATIVVVAVGRHSIATAA